MGIYDFIPCVGLMLFDMSWMQRPTTMEGFEVTPMIPAGSSEAELSTSIPWYSTDLRQMPRKIQKERLVYSKSIERICKTRGEKKRKKRPWAKSKYTRHNTCSNKTHICIVILSRHASRSTIKHLQNSIISNQRRINYLQPNLRS